MDAIRKNVMIGLMWPLFVIVVTFFILQQIYADDPPVPNAVVPFKFIDNQPIVSYQTNILFTTGSLPNGSSMWEEVDALGVKTGRTWFWLPNSALIWDILPTRDGTFGFEAALSALYSNNSNFTPELVDSFRNSNPNFRMFNPLLVYGQDKNMNGILETEEEGEWYLNESPIPDNCLPCDSFKNATTIIILQFPNNGDYTGEIPPILNYPLWYHQ